MSEKTKEILVPVDGSENSIRAAKFAMKMASDMGVGLRMFYVFPSASLEVIAIAGLTRDEIDQAAETAAQRAFDKTRQGVGENMIDQVEHEIAIGDPAEEIIRYTEDDHQILVVIGRRGLSRMRSLMLGSVSDKVLRHSKCPVTVIT